MIDPATPSSLSCYTPTSDVHSQISSLPHYFVPSSPTRESNISVRRIIRLWTWSPAIERLPVSISNWFPGFDEYINLSAVGTPTKSYRLSLFKSRARLQLTTSSLLLPVAKLDDLRYHLDCDTIDRSTVDDLPTRRNTEQQRMQAIELQALTNDAFDHFQKAIFGTSVFVKTNNKFRVSIPMNFVPCMQAAKIALASSECYCELESSVNPDQAALEIMLSCLKRLFDSKSRTLHAGYIPERLSEEKSTKEPAYAALSHGNSNSDTNDLHATTPYFAGNPASSCSGSSYHRVTTNYPGSSDPTLSEAAEWHELMNC